MTPEERKRYMVDRLAALYWKWVAAGKPTGAAAPGRPESASA